MADDRRKRSSSQDDKNRGGFVEFDYIPFEDIEWGETLGSGSFGCVYKGTYLGIDIALKEILPSNEYDVRKYFLREHTIMRECRHPNIVLFIGLCHAPPPDERTFIVSEFIPGGNLRGYIQDFMNRQFPWRLRISFAIDIARALAYLHARKCIHRDLKGENLLITGNERIKITDFGFARIAARDEAEMKRMSYCGTDGYMSPEILLGFDFDERTDVFSLGVIFAEIISRTLVDVGNAFTRFPPLFTLEEDEVRERANKGCPTDWIDLAIHCTASKPDDRPSMKQVLERLKRIEGEITSRLPLGKDEHIGSIKITSPPVKVPHHLRDLFTKEPPPTTVQSSSSTTDIRHSGAERHEGEEEVLDDDPEEDEVVEMLQGSTGRGHYASRQVTSWRTARWEEPREQKQSVMELFQSGPLPVEPSRHLPGEYPLGQSMPLGQTAVDTSSVVTIRPSPIAEPPTSAEDVQLGSSAPPPVARRANQSADGAPSVYHEALSTVPESADVNAETDGRRITGSGGGLPKSGNAASTSIAVLPTPTQAGTSPDGIHRFTIVNQKALRKVEAVKAKKQSAFVKGFNMLISSTTASDKIKCAVCGKRITKATFMQCDDCNINVHVRCSHAAKRNCVA